MRGKSAVLPFSSFLREAVVSSSGMGRDVHSLKWSVQHFVCRPQRCPPSEVPLRKMFTKGIVTHNVPEPCEVFFCLFFSSLDSCLEEFLWAGGGWIG